MKIITRLISAALFLLAAAACNLTEINNPDDPSNNGSGKKEYSITAKIIQTRVKYTDGAVLKQEWEKGDRLIGCYKSFSYVGGEPVAQFLPISFTVEKINSNGSANLKLESGTLPEDGTTIALLYDPYGDRELSSGSLSVDLTNQSFDIDNQDNQDSPILPAFMSASAVYTEAEGAEFVFQNDCAIIEVDGIYKTGKTSGSEINSVSSINIENVIALGSYTFNPSEGKFSLSGSGTGAVTVSCNRTLDWETGALDKPVFLAVIPNENTNNIGVTFSSNTEHASCAVAYYGSTAFAPGKCYVIYPKDMVAKTVDNKYFTSVAAAFKNAAVLAKTLGNDNTVTLVKDYINGLKEDVAHEVGYNPATIINIDYPVTLDLNGCTLTLDCYEEDEDDDNYLCAYDSFYSGGFSVEPSGELTIIDEKDCGNIDSCTECPIITNSGIVNIVGGSLAHYTGYQVVINNATGELNVSGGSISSDYGDYPAIDNFSQDLTISGGEIDGYYAIRNNEGAKANITGGSLNSDDDSAVVNYGELTVGDPDADEEDRESIEIISSAPFSNCPAIFCKTKTSNASVDIYYGHLKGNTGAVEILNGAQCEILGGYYESSVASTISINNGSDCTISGGVFVSYGSGVGTIAFYGGDAISTLSITWPAGISNPSPDTIHEPLIYSGNTGSATSLPISTFIGQGTKQPAQITIEGGYLISSNTNVNRFLYDASGDNLKVWDTENDKAIFGNFYSNVTKVLLYEESTTKDHNLTLENQQEIYGHSFEAIEQSGNGFAIPVIAASTGKLYKIDPVEENDGYPGTDLEPVEIGGVIWAPVNCGYDADHPYGLLYQWGRKYGQGYDGEPGAPTVENGNLVYAEDTDSWDAILFETHPDDPATAGYEGNANKFFYNDIGEWYGGNTPPKINLWDSSSDVIAVTDPDPFTSSEVSYHKPIKSKYDPCPDGWRVPTCYEFEVVLGSRVAGDSYEIVEDESTGAKGAYLCEGEFFLPFAGTRDGYYGEASERDESAWYWTSSVYYWSFDNSFSPVLLDCGAHFNTDLGGFGQACAIRCVKDE